MLHHISFGVSDIERSSKFYDAVLAPLGYERVWTDSGESSDKSGAAVGYGEKGGGDRFAIKLRSDSAYSSDSSDSSVAPCAGFHLAFAAKDRSGVDAFHLAALANGGTDNGAPGLRPRYGPSYYAAFALDPDGHHIEAVVSSDA